MQVYLPLEGLLDKGAERKRLEKEIGRLEGLIKGVKAKLDNEAFTAKAPAAVVDAERKKIADYESGIAKLGQNLKDLG